MSFKKALSALLILSMLAPNLALAGGKPAPAFDIPSELISCPTLTPMDEMQEKAFKTCSEIVAGKEMFDSERYSDSFWVDLGFSVARCFKGVGDGIFDAVKGVAYFVKLLAYEAPKWAWHKSKEAYHAAKEAVLKWWDDADDAVSGSIAASDANAEVHKGLIEQAEEMYKAFTEAVSQFFASARRMIEEEWHEFKCLPPSLQSEAMCKLVTDVFLLVVTPDKLVKGAKWTAELGKAMKGVLATLKAAPILKEGKLAEKVTRVGIALEKGFQYLKEGKILKRFGSQRLVEHADDAGNAVVTIERKIVKDGKEIWERIPAPMDGRTGTLTNAVLEGEKLLQDVVGHLASQAKKVSSSVVMFDVNHLGKVNYFSKGMLAGNEYLAAVAKVIKKAVRQEDVLSRYGGDEFILVLEKMTPAETQSVIAKINKAIANSDELKAIFTLQRKAMKEQYQLVAKAKSLEELAATTKGMLNEKALAEAAEDFAKFQARFLEEQQKAIYEVSKLEPSLSTGSKMLAEGDTLDSVVQVASKQIGEAKIAYYEEKGIDAAKYGGKALSKGAKPLNSRAKPLALPPAE